MIKVTRLDGKEYWINPHQIEYLEKKLPDVREDYISAGPYSRVY